MKGMTNIPCLHIGSRTGSEGSKTANSYKAIEPAQPDTRAVCIICTESNREIDTIHIIIHIGFPNLLKKKGAIEELEKDFQKGVNSVNQRLNIAIEKVKEPYRQPNILAEYIAFQLKNRVSFQKAMKKAIELTKKADIKGIKIQIAGCLA